MKECRLIRSEKTITRKVIPSTGTVGGASYSSAPISYPLPIGLESPSKSRDGAVYTDPASIQHDVDMNWIKHDKVVLWDNNFLASPKWKEKLQYFIDNDLKVSFNQGLDIRLINDEKAEMLSKVKYYDRNFSRRCIYFAFDDLSMKDIFIEKMKILTKYIKPYRIMVYFIVGFNSTFEDDMVRFEIMREIGVDPFAMPYKDVKKNKKMLDFCRWVNKRIYKSCSFKEYKSGGKE